MQEPRVTHPIPWIVAGSLTGLVLVPTTLALVASLVDGFDDFVFVEHQPLALAVSGTVGIILGVTVAGRALRSPRLLTIFGSVAGAVLGAAAMGSAFLAAAVAGEDWPDGLQVFLTGAAVGAAIGGLLGGLLGFGLSQPAPVSPER